MKSPLKKPIEIMKSPLKMGKYPYFMEIPMTSPLKTLKKVRLPTFRGADLGAGIPALELAEPHASEVMTFFLDGRPRKTSKMLGCTMRIGGFIMIYLGKMETELTELTENFCGLEDEFRLINW